MLAASQSTDAPEHEPMTAEQYAAHVERRRLNRVARFATALPPVSTYDDFVAHMVARRHALGLSQVEVDLIAGFASGHTGRLEQWQARNGRVAGAKTIPRWIRALWPAPDGVTTKP